jgi:hypothetical protein
MKELVFALEFKGSGIQAAVESTGAGSASFESEVEIVGEGMFVESGRIRYGDAGTLSFKTVGRGVLGPSPVAGLQKGAIVWEVTGGDGRLAGAQGLITSNFTVGANGEVVDDQFARIFVP